MDFTLTREQEMLRETVRAFAEEVLKPRAAGLDRSREFPLDNYRRCAELGLCGMMVPEAYGGAGFDGVSYVIGIEEVSRACASTGVILSVNNSLFCAPILRHGSEAQKTKYLAPHARGERIGAYCLTEPQAGSDAGALRTMARRKGNTYVLSGSKVFVTNGVAAHTFIVYATLDPALRHKGICAFIVERDFPGLRLGKPEHKMGITCSGSVEIVLDECVVPAENLLGKEGEGFKIAMGTLDGGRIGIAAQAIGIAGAALEESLAYSRSREAFGRPIADFQAIQWKLADMATEIEAARLLAYRAAWTRDNRDRCSLETSMAKLFASEACMRAAKEGVQIHGGYGYINEYTVERLFRDAKITEIYEGTSEVQRLVISKEILRED
ncbi:MAG TPA: acyl-CoA dehydrogenase family protein [Candidatus Binatia bacterium]|nr:acyl-CoA dehydrogenase family protein [Candidatus Binatia bacterium]